MSATTENSAAITASDVHRHCWLCGNLNPRSLKLSFQVAADGGVRSRFRAPAELQGYDGVLHGGVIASALDAAMTHCLFQRGVQGLTGDLHVRFARPVSCNVELELRAWLSACQPPLYRLKAELTQNDRVMAWGEAKFVRRRER